MIKLRKKKIYQELQTRVENGESFIVDFKNQNLKIGKEYLINNGQWDEELYELGIQRQDSILDILNIIEDLFLHYKFSIPSEQSNSKYRVYFKALDMEELSMENLIYGQRREYARASLEGYLLLSVLNHSFIWDDTILGKWFWQSENHPELIILKEWIQLDTIR